MLPSNNKQPFFYNDKLIWLIGYPIAAISFVFFANDNSLVTLIGLPSFISDLVFALLMTYTVGLYLKLIVKYLDKSYSWGNDFKTRLLKQLLYGVICPLIASMLLEVGYLYVINIPLKSSSILNLELPLTFIFLLLANLFYLVNYLFYFRKATLDTVKEPSIPQPIQHIGYITVQKGYTETRIFIEDCALLVCANKVVWLHTFTGEQYRLQGTMEMWQEKLASANFYRINRQYLSSLNAIQSIEQTETRKLKVNFLTTSEAVFVSKLNVASFKQWWKR